MPELDTPPLDNAPPPIGDWISISALARKLNVSRQAACQRVAKLVPHGLTITPGPNRSKLVRESEFTHLAGEMSHLGRAGGAQLRSAVVAQRKQLAVAAREQLRPDVSKPSPAVAAFSNAQAQRAAAEAELAEIRLMRLKGQLLDAGDVKAAIETCGMAAAEKLEDLPRQAPQILDDLRSVGVTVADATVAISTLRSTLKRVVFAVRREMAGALQQLAKGEDNAAPR
jgi:hypothetical protein